MSKMSNPNYGPKIIFPKGFDERSQHELPLRGCLNNVQVELEDGSRYAVEFIDPVRLAQEVDDYVRLDVPCYAEPGLIILPQVTLESVQKAVRYLHDIGFFDSLKPQTS